MPIQELKPRGSFSQTIGDALGQGLGGGLNRYLDQLGLQGGGFSPQEASLVSRLGSKEQAPFIENLLAGLNSGPAPESRVMSAQPGQPSAQESPGFPAAQSPVQRAMGQEQIAPQQQRLTPYQRGIQAKQQGAQKKEARADQVLADKETKKYYEKVKDDADFSDKSLKRLSRMEKLIEKGDIPPAIIYNAIEGLANMGAHGGHGLLGDLVGQLAGLFARPLGGLLRRGEIKDYPDLEEFEKISTDFTRDIKKVYGARISNFELEQFMKMLPTLSQTDVGKKAVIRNIRNFNELALAENKAMKDIIKENKGRRPINLQEIVEDRIAPLKDEFANDFKEAIVLR